MYLLKKAFILVLGTLWTMSAGSLAATDLTLYDIGPKAATMGGAFVGCADNTTAIFYNPAGLAFQKSLGFRVNVAYYNYRVEARTDMPQRTDMTSERHLMGSAFLAYTYKDRISIGIGAFTPYSFVTKWPSQWPGDPLCINSELNVFSIRPAFAIRVSKFLSVGAGLDLINANVKWDFHNIHSVLWSLDGSPWVMNQLNASGKGTGFAVGVLFQLTDKFRIGGRYQKKVELNLQGKNEYSHGNFNRFDDIAPLSIPEFDTSKPEFYNRQKAVFFLPLPSEAVVGILLTPAERFSFQADVQWTEWSRFKKWEFVAAHPEESFFFEPSESEETDDEPTEGAREGIELNMMDTWSFKLGGEYYLRDELSLRIGYARHQSPFDDKNLTPILPLLSRNVFSFGVGYDGPARSITNRSLIGNLTFDAYVQYVMFEEKTSSYPDHPLTFGGNYWVFGVGVGFYL